MVVTKLLITMALAGVINNNLATKLTFKSGDCIYNPEFFSNFSLKIINSKVSIDIILLKPLVAGLKSRLKFEFRVSKAKSYQSVFQHDMNYCAMLKGVQESLYRHWFDSMLKVGNFSTSCPIPQGYSYIHDWTLDGKLVPSFLYLGDYRICGSFFYGRSRNKLDKPMVECTVEAILIKN